ncbi:hypothetical protein Ahy_A02g005958 isoform B [Arachis hypogaea]|uniref:Uncharacterized protein n=1 Tax=Arachis hypogaea TaxID=3818 RepID=A0A445E8X5_ARAHY|nr:hypothetical protein Ahy_A02g005958 isoform B [Arachis hypogaea]
MDEFSDKHRDEYLPRCQGALGIRLEYYFQMWNRLIKKVEIEPSDLLEVQKSNRLICRDT